MTDQAGAGRWAPAVVPDAPAQYPQGYRRCPTCQAYIGSPCTAAAASIVDGQPVGGPVNLLHPHRARKVRAGWEQ